MVTGIVILTPLPGEINLVILNLLDWTSILPSKLVCKKWKYAMHQLIINLYERDYGLKLKNNEPLLRQEQQLLEQHFFEFKRLEQSDSLISFYEKHTSMNVTQNMVIEPLSHLKSIYGYECVMPRRSGKSTILSCLAITASLRRPKSRILIVYLDGCNVELLHSIIERNIPTRLLHHMTDKTFDLLNGSSITLMSSECIEQYQTIPVFTGVFVDNYSLHNRQLLKEKFSNSIIFGISSECLNHVILAKYYRPI